MTQNLQESLLIPPDGAEVKITVTFSMTSKLSKSDLKAIIDERNVSSIEELRKALEPTDEQRDSLCENLNLATDDFPGDPALVEIDRIKINIEFQE